MKRSPYNNPLQSLPRFRQEDGFRAALIHGASHGALGSSEVEGREMAMPKAVCSRENSEHWKQRLQGGSLP